MGRLAELSADIAGLAVPSSKLNDRTHFVERLNSMTPGQIKRLANALSDEISCKDETAERAELCARMLFAEQVLTFKFAAGGDDSAPAARRRAA